MNIQKITVLILAVAAAAQAHAGDFQVKNRSVFSSGGVEHNPFWPIGWTKAAGSANGNGVAPLLKPDDFLVTSILINEPPLAVINGKEMAEGEVLVMNVAGQQVRVQLASVQDGRVILRYLDQNLVVPLHRKGETAMRAATAMK